MEPIPKQRYVYAYLLKRLKLLYSVLFLLVLEFLQAL